MAETGNGPHEHPLVYVSFYEFASLPDYEELRLSIKQKCDEQGVAGGIIIAPEGINGSICGTRDGIDAVLSFLRSDPRLASMRNTEGPGPAEAARPCSPVEGARKAGQESSSRAGVGAGGEELKATPFQQDRVHVKVKKEVIPLGVEVDPTQRVGTYVKPEDWNALISDPDVVVVDVRNEYETRIGRFKGAVDPRTVSFKDFPDWVEKNLLRREADAPPAVDRVSSEGSASSAGRRHFGENQGDPRGSIEEGVAPSDSPDRTSFAETRSTPALEIEEESGSRGLGAGSLAILDEKGKGGQLAANLAKARKVAMYCTGGIRCEKSTSLLLQMGFKEVYHLEGGILQYLHETPREESLWEGECFVFDRRTSVKHGMEPGSYSLCFACKQPITKGDMESHLFITGVQCPHCAHKKTEKQKERDRQRQMQFERYGLIGGVLKKKPPKKAAAGTKREVEEKGRVGSWVTHGVPDVREENTSLSSSC